MGIFEYECASCGHVTDHYVSLAERPEEVPCESCSKTAHRIVSAVKTTFHAADRRAIKGQTVNRGGNRV